MKNYSKNPLDILNDLKSWQKYKKGMCETCIGLCCYMPVEVTNHDLVRLEILDPFHLNLNEREIIKTAQQHPAIDRFTKSTNKYTLVQKPNMSCFYLDKNGRCTVYEKRPDTCRNHPQIGPRPEYCAYVKKSL
jgi:Fe-S-cluster containining protein